MSKSNYFKCLCVLVMSSVTTVQIKQNKFLYNLDCPSCPANVIQIGHGAWPIWTIEKYMYYLNAAMSNVLFVHCSVCQNVCRELTTEWHITIFPSCLCALCVTPWTCRFHLRRIPGNNIATSIIFEHVACWIQISWHR